MKKKKNPIESTFIIWKINDPMGSKIVAAGSKIVPSVKVHSHMKCRVNFLQLTISREDFFDCFSYETRCEVLCFHGITHTPVLFENSISFLYTFKKNVQSWNLFVREIMLNKAKWIRYSIRRLVLSNQV